MAIDQETMSSGGSSLSRASTMDAGQGMPASNMSASSDPNTVRLSKIVSCEIKVCVCVCVCVRGGRGEGWARVHGFTAALLTFFL
jgi:hypothetical protein